MPDRYTRLLSFDNPIWCEDSPVIIEKGALLSDSQRGQNLLQLKLRNVGARSLKAVVLDIDFFDVTGRLLGTIQHSYLDLDAKGSPSFGEDQPVWLEDATARGFRFRIENVVFTDGTTWRADSVMRDVEPAEALDSLGDLKGQFIRDVASVDPKVIPRVLPTDHEGLWHCTCGAVNASASVHCQSCGLNHEMQKALADKSQLKEGQADFEARSAEEMADQERENGKHRAKKTRNRRVVAVVVVVLAILGVVFGPPLYKEVRYSQAMASLKSGDYSGALSAFRSLPNDFKDVSLWAAKFDKAEQRKGTYEMAFSGKVADYAPVYTGTVSEFDENALAVQPVISDGDVCLQLYCDARRSTDQHGTPFATVPAEAMETALPGEDTIASNTTAVWSTDGSFTVRYDIVYVGGGSEQDEDVYSKVSPDYIGPYANIGAR